MVNQRDLNLLLKGKAPADPVLLKEMTVGTERLTDFLSGQYLGDYIPNGGSKIKFITGRPGSGKSHVSGLLLAEAAQKGYRTVSFSAKEVRLDDFRDIYLEVLSQCDIEQVLQGCAAVIIREMGYDPSDIPEGKNFMDILSERNEADPISRGEIRGMLRKFFTKNPVLDNNFASCCSLLCGGILGHPVLEPANRELLMSYLKGDKSVKLPLLRALGLSPQRITKFNARYLLRSLSEVVHLSGCPGLVIRIEDMEQLLNRSSEGIIRYTRLRREDTYESIRQLIDDIDHIMFLLVFDRELMENDSYGMKSYQALWMRVQSEVVSTRFNCFADIIDLDRYAEECYGMDALCEMAVKLSETLQKQGIPAKTLEREEADKLAERAAFGGLGLPYLVNRAIVPEGVTNE